ncbi:MAG: DegV family protein [Methylocystaceae bacterium]
MAIKVITDSSCDLPESLVLAKDIAIIPLTVSFTGDPRVYRDQVDITTHEFWNRMFKSKFLPKTSTPDPQTFIDNFEKWLQLKGEVIYIGLSSGLSSTFQTAQLALQLVGSPQVKLVDSLSASLGTGIQVLKAIEYVGLGLSLEEVTARVIEYRDSMETIFTLDTLENVVKGGRLSRVAGVVGGIVDFKPIFRGINGKVELYEKLRGRKKALKRLVDLAGCMGKTARNRIVGITHVDCLTEVEYLANQIRERYNPQNILISEMGATIGTYAGRGGILLHF